MTKVKVIASKQELPPKAAMYSGQTGEVIGTDRVGQCDYYRVRFSNGDVAAYLKNEIREVS